MKKIIISASQPDDHKDYIESLLLGLATIFLFILCVILTLSPAVREHTWAVEYRWQPWIGFIVWAAGFWIVRSQVGKILAERDPLLLPCVALLSGWGLISVWRIDTVLGARQTVWLGLCMAVLIGGLRLPVNLNLLRRHKYIWLTGGLLLTALTFFFGAYPGGVGPRLWLGCCGVYFQPSEPLKLLLIIYLAAYLADRMLISLSLLQLITPTLVLLAVALLLLIGQRDLGTASIFIFLDAAMLYVASGRRRIIVLSLISLALAIGVGYVSFDVVRVRIDAWINPWLDPTGRSYQIVQSLIALAAGGLFGRGPGIGNPGIVPVAHSDFIFAAITEETGLVGGLALLVLIGLLVVRGFRAALRAPDLFHRYLAAGLSLYLGVQSLLIIGGNLRLFPLTGVTLPFVSYGGSSLLTSFIAFAILLQISHQPDDEPTWLPNPRPYLLLAGGLLIGLLSAGLILGWWAIFRAENLVVRNDNPRWAINDRYVQRGSVVDRNDQPLATTTGHPGSYTRDNLYPPLSPVVGYTNSMYGQGGLEASLDPYLRGLAGNSSALIWWTNLLYGQPPPGLNIRLALDLDRQRQIDSLIGQVPGGAVLLNSETGEILAMASHPYFDANRLREEWVTLIKDPAAPLLNRAAQGLYPPGTSLGPFMIVEAKLANRLPTLPQVLELPGGPKGYSTCLAPPPTSPTWEGVVAVGCPTPLVALANAIGGKNLLELYGDLGLFTPPEVSLPTASQSPPDILNDLQNSALGANLQISPLQMALAAASLNDRGVRPAPRLVLSVDIPGQGWAPIPAEARPTQVFEKDQVGGIMHSFAVESKPYWAVLAQASNGQGQPVTWFIGGSLSEWQGTPVAIAIALETDQTSLVRSIGTAILDALH